MAKLVSMVPLLKAAEHRSRENPGKGSSIGAFNVNFYAQAEGILEGLRRAGAPGIIQASRGANKFQGGASKIQEMVLRAMSYLKMDNYPICLHLDHGTPETCVECIQSGFSSVMVDMSEEPLERNIAVTAEIVKIARKKGVSVEGEYGGLGGIEEDVEQQAVYSNPLLVPYFFAETGADALAVTYGTSHGPNKFGPEVNLDHVLKIEVVEKSYRGLVAYGMSEKCFLVGHGSSTIPKDLIAEINAHGGKLKDARGVPLEKIIAGRDAGIRKFNIDTDLRLGITAEFRRYLYKDNPGIVKKCEPLRLAKDVFDGKIPAKDKDGKPVDPGKLTDPRSYLDPIDREILRKDYRGTEMEELMTRVKNRVASHVEMLVTQVFNCAGLADSVKV